MDVYVGNLPFDATEEELRRMFEPFGPIGCVLLINDSFSGRALGFGFVELLDEQKAGDVVSHLDRTKLHGRTLIVRETERRIERRVKRTPSCVQV